MIASTIHHAARAIVALATALMPRDLQHWGMAMRAEVHLHRRPGAALMFACGCLIVALRLAVVSRPTRNMDATVMPIVHDLSRRPRAVAALCAVAATGLGLIYLALAGAPAGYLAMNTAALVAGLLAMGIIGQAARIVRPPAAWVTIALAVALLAATVGGTSVNDATRWLALGGLIVQPSLIVVPVLATLFAQRRDTASAIGVAVTAVALALQPDRAMAGALAAGMLGLFALRRERATGLALVAAAAGFVVAMIRPDVQPAMPWVDGILYSAFDVHLLAGAAVMVGSTLLVVPAIVGLRGGAQAEASAVFGAVWLATIAAAALGNYPTPLVGYGGSAILGYLIALTALPGGRTRDLSARGWTECTAGRADETMRFAAMA